MGAAPSHESRGGHVLVLDAGSSSLHIALFAADGEKVADRHASQPPGPSDIGPAETLSSHINAMGIAATYAATFGAQEQLRIAERRANSRNGAYEFRGARLLHYSGSGLSSAEPIELRFDLQGALTLSKAGSGPVPPAEISAIRERAQLLRSHALAQKTSRDHH